LAQIQPEEPDEQYFPSSIPAQIIASRKNEQTLMKVLLLYRPIYGHTWQLARAAEEGVKPVAGIEAMFRRAPTIPQRRFTHTHPFTK
jgi:hypothetical protein